MVRALGTVLFAALVFACSSTEEEEAPKYPTVDSMCQARATEECQVASKCGAKLETCVASRKATCATSAAASQTGTRAYRAKVGETCVNKAKEVYAKAPITPDDIAKLDETCQKAFQGTQAKLQACTTSYDCDGELICDKQVCAGKVEKKEGEFCGNPGEVCAAGSYCVASAAGALQCAPKKKKGEICDAKSPCLESLRCNNTCLERFGSGEACASNDDCGASAPLCDNINLGSKCGPGVTPVAGVAACKDCPAGANPAYCGFGG
ncbi:MAG: hypothetical protein IPG50_01305 [Myxococcales bacterium]|nr:hypothetical protein [Myxococcales bacterium]